MATQARGIADERPPRHDAPRPRAIIVAGGKGGVGKTQIAVNLAVALGLKRRSVLLVDGNLDMGGVDLALGMEMGLNLGHAARGERTVEEIVFAGPADIGVVAAPRGEEECAALAPWQRERLARELAAAAAGCDFLIIDSAAGAAPAAFDLAHRPEVIAVATPDPAAVADAYATAKHAARCDPRADVQVVVNFAADALEVRRAWHAIAEVAGKFLERLPGFLGHVPQDPLVMRAGRRQEVLVVKYPESPAAEAIAAIAARLCSRGAGQATAADARRGAPAAVV